MWQSPFTGQPWGGGVGVEGTILYVTVNIYLSASIMSIKQKSTQGNSESLWSYCKWHLAFTGQPPGAKSNTEAVSNTGSARERYSPTLITEVVSTHRREHYSPTLITDVVSTHRRERYSPTLITEVVSTHRRECYSPTLITDVVSTHTEGNATLQLSSLR